jgi:hypothetical protein
MNYHCISMTYERRGGRPAVPPGKIRRLDGRKCRAGAFSVEVDTGSTQKMRSKITSDQAGPTGAGVNFSATPFMQ